MTFLAWLLVVMAAASIVLGPLLIGKERPPFTAGTYVVQLCVNAVWVAVAGHVLGWW